MGDVAGLRALLHGSVSGSEPALGTFVTDFHGAGVVHLAAAAGAQFVVLDDEHSAVSSRGLRDAIQAAHAAGVFGVVRVASSLPEHVSRALDLGAHGVMVPMVRDIEEVRAVVAAAKYPPDGRRGVALSWAHHDTRADSRLPERLKGRNESQAVLIQIETAEAVDQIEDIAGTPGVDAVWLGHLDLSVSLGVPGDFTSEAFVAARQRVLDAAHRHGIPAGYADLTGEETPDLLAAGFRLLAVGTDADLYRRALERSLTAARQAPPRKSAHATTGGPRKGGQGVEKPKEQRSPNSAT